MQSLGKGYTGHRVASKACGTDWIHDDLCKYTGCSMLISKRNLSTYTTRSQVVICFLSSGHILVDFVSNHTP